MTSETVTWLWMCNPGLAKLDFNMIHLSIINVFIQIFMNKLWCQTLYQALRIQWWTRLTTFCLAFFIYRKVIRIFSLLSCCKDQMNEDMGIALNSTWIIEITQKMLFVIVVYLLRVGFKSNSFTLVLGYRIWHRVVISRMYSLTGRMEKIRRHWCSHPTLNIVLKPGFSRGHLESFSNSPQTLYFSQNPNCRFLNLSLNIILLCVCLFCPVICYSFSLEGPALFFICLVSLHSFWLSLGVIFSPKEPLLLVHCMLVCGTVCPIIIVNIYWVLTMCHQALFLMVLHYRCM